MKIKAAYQSYFSAPVKGRYVVLEDVLPLIKNNSEVVVHKTGISEKGKEIPVLKIGKGSKKALAWSQMHGNESTTTKAVIDFLQFLNQKDVFQKEKKRFLNSYTLYLIPILNPDGAEAYTRENANNIDLNRDAHNRTQQESKLLYDLFTEVKPDLCLNLHDQRTIYGLENKQPATVSFLAPSADTNRTVTATRKTAMKEIVKMHRALKEHIPCQIGRYDDSFNINCVGDSFTAAGVPTLLFEAGHYQNDYQREKTREFIFYALVELFGIGTFYNEQSVDYLEYFNIPENKKNFRDIILRDVYLEKEQRTVSVAIQYQEILTNGKIHFIPVIEAIDEVTDCNGHKELSANGNVILVNSHENFRKGEKVLTIHYKNNGKEIIFQ
ncbi:M14 family zinc carboxypeptidase [Marixanthomonas spongiae]|uniref:Peptidase M14 n=1 Tax=Marixanthomonas spongiae TaxID=2174845 RepID=A0A2U0HYD0_9FLAO|nr:M14 family zinc carboxypeptidase [Marixanthomonas spongiae]PVW13829.1 peptidase M14 [Marixanthomonas spongiae]